MPQAHALSVLTGVGGCGWPSSSRVRRVEAPSWVFMNRAPVSASVADAMTFGMILLRTRIGPLYFGGLCWIRTLKSPDGSFGAFTRSVCWLE